MLPSAVRKWKNKKTRRPCGRRVLHFQGNNEETRRCKELFEKPGLFLILLENQLQSRKEVLNFTLEEFT